ncbi:putative ADP-ribosylation factor [Apostichopus japonicus]|uniref:Putative ADP-ribosylation factor n=1 Tax=Stichopus japonicus TaxID=307972 RepID=A0A2G8JNW2_STIJA|nr:putative ADP-ribosylation factor [Apostichopus japonicus]
MGLLISKTFNLLRELGSGKPTRVILIGLDAAGKTTILYKMKLHETVTTIPTIGFNVEEVTPVPGLTMVVWDVGGQEKIRALWHHYYQNSEGIIFVVDSADAERFPEAREELHAVLKDDQIAPGVPIVIMANKQDLPHSAGASKLIESLDLRTITRHPWHIQGTCATNGDGLYESFESLAKMVKEYRKGGVHRY